MSHPASAAAAAAAAASAPDECPICLDSISLGTCVRPDACRHRGCRPCLMDWAKASNRRGNEGASCPVCRCAIAYFLLESGVSVALPAAVDYTEDDLRESSDDDAYDIDDDARCHVCRANDDDDDVLILCDGCDKAFHPHCAGLESIPHGDWYCSACAEEAEYV